MPSLSNALHRQPILALASHGKFNCFAMLLGVALSATAQDDLSWREVADRGKTVPLTHAVEVREGTFNVDAPGMLAAQLECRWIVPYWNGAKAARADEAVFFFHTPNDDRPITNDICQRLAKESGFTVFTIAFGANSDPKYYFSDDRIENKKFYTYESAGSFATIRRAWEHVRLACALPHENFFLYGYSAGGIGVQRFSEYSPSLCAAVVTMCGHSFVRKRGARCPFFVGCTYGDAGLPESEALRSFYASEGMPVLAVDFDPNWELLKRGDAFSFHAPNPKATPITQRYFEAVADMRRQRKSDSVDLTRLSPYVIDAFAPKHICKNTEAASQRIAAHGGFPEPIPSAALYAEIMNVAPPIHREEHGSAFCLVAEPPPVEHGGATVAVWWPQMLDEQASNSPVASLSSMLLCDLRFLTSHGCSAIAYASAHLTDDPTVRPADASESTFEKATAAILFSCTANDVRQMRLGGVTQLILVFPSIEALESNLTAISRMVPNATIAAVVVAEERAFQTWSADHASIASHVHPLVPSPKSSDSLREPLHQQALEAAVQLLNVKGKQ